MIFVSLAITASHLRATPDGRFHLLKGLGPFVVREAARYLIERRFLKRGCCFQQHTVISIDYLEFLAWMPVVQDADRFGDDDLAFA